MKHDIIQRNDAPLIVNAFRKTELYSEREVCLVRADGTESVAVHTAVSELLTDVYINDVLTMKLISTPQYVAELVLGRLLSEGMIRGMEDVRSLYICENGLTARAQLNREARKKSDSFADTVPSCCTGNRLLNDYFLSGEMPDKMTPANIRPEDVFACAKALERSLPLHEHTHSSHAAVLMKDGELLFCAEDIGRHNALDKVIGHALLNGIPLSACVAGTTGRVPSDMVIKAVRAGVPVLISLRTPSGEGIDIASAYGLKLIGRAGERQYFVYH